MLERLTAKRIGDCGEAVAARYLKTHGYKIVAKNFRSAHGEVDLVAESGDALVFVEVKTRKDCAARFDDYGLPCEAVNAEKQRHILYTARIFLEKHPTDKYIRFDVVEIYRSEDGKSTRVNHIESAFEAR
mgnify:FL=1|jgi:TIGR00252 family protein